MQEYFSRPPPSEDYVQYCIYLPDAKDVVHLQQQATLISSFVLQWTDGYIWQKDPFGLVVVSSTQTQAQEPSFAYLKGRTRFGDAIEDEWFIVFLLREISKQWQEAVISVSDSDGEFLLIEAAKEIPKWLTPSNSTNRVFLHKGQLHIIPIPKTPVEREEFPSGKLTVTQGIELVASSTTPTVAADKVQAAVFDRISSYPDKARQNIHHACVMIPRAVASVLKRDPQMVAPAVESFYMRDPITMRAIHRMERFPPADSVSCTIPVTRTLYAQLVAQRFHAPKPFRLPPVSSPEFKAAELGMKLACGMEMLAAEKPRSSATHTENATLDTYDFDRDDEYIRFRNRLSQLGYFKGETQGSKLYQQLEIVAKEQHLRDKDGDEQQPEHPSLKLSRLLSLPLIQDAELDTTPEDSDAWMDMNASDLEAAFAARRAVVNFRDSDEEEEESDEDSSDDEADVPRRYQRMKEELQAEDVDEDDEDGEWEDEDMEERDGMSNITNMVRQLEIFMSGQSGLDGVEMLDEFEDEDDEDDDILGDEDEEDVLRQISLDPDSFLREMGRALGMPMDELRPNRASSSRSGPTITEITSDDDDEETLLPADPMSGPQPPKPPRTYNSKEPKTTNMSDDSDEDTEADIEAYMKAMDRELFSTRLARDFERVEKSNLKKTKKTRQPDSDDDDDDTTSDEDDEYMPIDMDVNLVKNMLESFQAQDGLPGPTSTLFESMGVALPRPDHYEEDEAEEGDMVEKRGVGSVKAAASSSASKQRKRSRP
ncbi:hypothetical protein SmJEL517_g00703 [Synchytrium microbalum]|uniref:SGT1-domain-containing protein n=1 Tax=Synchytrium microbalum TaxID=1806994 RepID=A0A507CCZ0_9FUNG|nr:uncharacterized protein SmJEL517_g00703 [Synchytrium microbalum]TPX37482.1 hypothetical protein SmJEL517_g00703 [Synchytrium microbalum]